MEEEEKEEVKEETGVGEKKECSNLGCRLAVVFYKKVGEALKGNKVLSGQKTAFLSLMTYLSKVGSISWVEQTLEKVQT